jgi:glutaredoxin
VFRAFSKRLILVKQMSHAKQLRRERVSMRRDRGPMHQEVGPMRKEVGSMRALIYYRAACPHCQAAMATLRWLCGTDPTHLTALDISETPALQPEAEALQQKNNPGPVRFTVPQIVLNGRYIGGNDALQAVLPDLRQMRQAMLARRLARNMLRGGVVRG